MTPRGKRDDERIDAVWQRAKQFRLEPAKN